MLSDAHPAVLEPLVDAGRREAETPLQEPRHTLSTILRRDQSGPKWRAISQELGSLWRTGQILIWRPGGAMGECLLLSCGASAFNSA